MVEVQKRSNWCVPVFLPHGYWGQLSLTDHLMSGILASQSYMKTQDFSGFERYCIIIKSTVKPQMSLSVLSCDIMDLITLPFRIMSNRDHLNLIYAFVNGSTTHRIN